MTRQNSRRAFLQSVGAVSFTGVASASTDTETDITATDLVIPESAAPPDFDRIQTSESNRFAEALSTVDPLLESTEIAVAGYWNGTTQTDPEWVLSSMAIVANDPLPRATIETAAEQAYDEYVDEYDEETSRLIEFEQIHARSGQTTEWGIDIHRAPMFANATDDTDVVFSERMRFQFFDVVALATLAFGPSDEEPAVDALVDEYAALQRIRYENHGERQ